MKKKKIFTRERLIVLVESAVFIALASALAFVKITISLTGGSITLLSMLPIIFLSYRRGVSAGLAGGFVYSLVQIIDGIDNFIATTFAGQLGILFLDYLLPFALLGIAGFFGRKKTGKALGVWSGVGITVVLGIRYICHCISSLLIWVPMFGIDEAYEGYTALAYALVYNLTFMGPELLFTLVAGIPLIVKLKNYRLDKI